MSPSKHLPLEKFEAIDMSLHDAVVPRKPESRLHSGIVSTNPVDKTAQFSHMTRFRLLEPGVQGLHLAFFEHGDKFLAQQIDGAQILVVLHLLYLLLLHLDFRLQDGKIIRKEAPREERRRFFALSCARRGLRAGPFLGLGGSSARHSQSLRRSNASDPV